jgi:hypothetical protein
MSILHCPLKFIEGNICHLSNFQRLVPQTFSSEILRKRSGILPALLCTSRLIRRFLAPEKSQMSDLAQAGAMSSISSFVICYYIQ